MKLKNFSHFGTFGDTIYSLCVVKLLGGGNMYIKLNYLNYFCTQVLGWPNAGPGAGRYTKEDFDMIAPLLEAQEYLHEVSVYENQKIDIDFENHYRFHLLGSRWRGNQTECYALTQNLNIHDEKISKALIKLPWLDNIAPIYQPEKICINRTSRHHHGETGDSKKVYEKFISDDCFFVGTEQEHTDFCDEFKCDVRYQRTNDLLELARYINGCEMFLGNQSSALAIAIGLGKDLRYEIRKDYQSEYMTSPHGHGDVWFPRDNIGYF